MKQAAAIIAERAPNFRPKVALVLGSGLGSLVDSLQVVSTIAYTDLPGFPQESIEGQTGQLTLGELNGTKVVCLQGRPHRYAGDSYDIFKTYVRTLKLIGCEVFLSTNAAGSLRTDLGAGSLMMITDHINFQSGNPLAGPNEDEFGPRFPPLDKAYDPDLQQLLKTTAAQLGTDLAAGVYISVPGPSYETAAEIRAFKLLGADAIGMSTVPEVIIANHCALKVVAIAAITNLATGLSDISHDHAAVVAAAQQTASKLSQLITTFVAQLR